ncbi:hypothetical protein VTN77DRAFT_4036 [Rasamsonia byssochlamydoides]|uniref:uncharacterized protein n=1 Tax=Rasamsonia byssochlamydoides TaxID=89139 RepID=UPI0037420ED7
MSNSNYAIPPGSTVVVTGANGYIASHIVDLLLSLGFHVRGTVRAEKPWLDRLFEERHGKGRYESVVVPRMDVEGALDEVAKGAAGLIHVASDVSLNPDPNTVIPSAVKLTLNALQAAAKQPSIKRFVLTSSSTAALVPKPNQEGVVVEKDTWNDEAVAAAWDEATPAEARPYVVYAASKVEAEKAAWKWVETHKPGFVLNAVLPNFNSGPILHPEIRGSTMGWARNLLKGDASAMNLLPPQYFVDVRDNARLHIAALLDPNIHSERLFAFAHEFNWTDIIQLFRKLRPNNTRIPDPPANEGRDLSDIRPRKRAEEILRSFFGKSWTGLEESFAAGIEGWE